MTQENRTTDISKESRLEKFTTQEEIQQKYARTLHTRKIYKDSTLIYQEYQT